MNGGALAHSPSSSGAVPQFTQVVTIPQAAKLVGWTRRRMFRLLTAHNQRMGGALLFNAGLGTKRPVWTVSLGALKNLTPQWVNDPEQIQMSFEFLQDHAANTDDAIADLRSEVKALRGQIGMLVEAVTRKQA